MKCKNCGHELLVSKRNKCKCCGETVIFVTHKNRKKLDEKGKCFCGCNNPEPEKEVKDKGNIEAWKEREAEETERRKGLK